jgi:restriction system protein
MAYRRRRHDVFTDIAQLGALLVLAFAFVPFLRGVVLICAGIGLLLLVGFIAYRLTQKRSKPSPSESELVGQLRAIDWFQFEKVVALVCRKLDYAVTRRGGANPDGDIDLLLEKNGERRAIQCKHWKTRQVGVRHVREFLGALADAGVQKGSFVTLGGCTGEAQALAERHAIEVINESQLVTMLKAADAAHDPDILALLRDTRKYCPKCEQEMVLRTASRGTSAGSQFWGCSAYPSCQYTMPA